jgi:RNA polymerase sigma-70 factor (ECF subfamily)
MGSTAEQDALFADHRSMVFAVAYQVLGTRADADDVVQETYLRWADVDLTSVRDPRAYLATIATRTALNRVRTVSRRRETYPGPWLPEPLVADHENPEQRLLMKEQLSYALSVLLQQATPEQRVVFVLHDIFGLPYPAVAEAVGKTQGAVRQVAHRARTRLGGTEHAEAPAAAEVLEAFLAAVVTGDLQALVDVLAPGVVLLSDGGGKVVAALKPITGAQSVASFLLKIAQNPVPQVRVAVESLNGGLGVLIWSGDRLELTVALAVDGRRKVTGVYLVRNPDKLVPAAGR